MAEVKSTLAAKILLVLCSTVLVLLGSELLFRAFSIDLLVLRKVLYYQNALVSSHRTSSDARRLIELRPGSSVQMGPLHLNEKKYEKTHITLLSVNALGFRGQVFPSVKRAGVFRIMIFGASNTFGLGVSDEDTYPAQMQKIFDEQYPGKVEVWNGGVCGYQMSQSVASAEAAINKFDPDLVILQDTNRGRRPFHAEVTVRELRDLFGKNPELFAENIPSFKAWAVTSRGHLNNFLTLNSALYRTIYTGLHMRHWDPKKVCFTYGQQISDRDFNRFTERHKDRKIILFYIAEGEYQCRIVAIQKRENLGVFLLNNRGKPPEYRELHPPSYVYAWYAREFCDFLAKNGYLPAKGLGQEKPDSL